MENIFYLVSKVGFGKLEEKEVLQIKNLQYLYSINLLEEGSQGADGYECRIYHLSKPIVNGPIPWVNVLNQLSAVVVQATISGSELKTHLNNIRKHTRPNDEEPVYIRFFDGKVLKNFLPVFQNEDLKWFFGPISSFAFMNDLRTEWQSYSYRDDKLEIETRPISESIHFIGDVRNVNSIANSKSDTVPEPEGFQAKLILVDDGQNEFLQALSKSSPDQLSEIFSDGVCYYSSMPEGTFRLFFLNEKKLLASEVITRDMLEIRLKEEEVIRDKNQKGYSDSITKPENKANNTSVSGELSSKSKIWSWLKI
jgi:hypothetical protein